jgi:hypothetical protein
MVMLITEHGPRSLRQPRTQTRRGIDLSRVRGLVQNAVRTLSAAGSFRAWACLIIVGYVFAVAITNLARFGLER